MNRNEDLSEPPRLLSSFGARAWYISISIACRRNEPIWDEGRSECRRCMRGGAAAAAIREAAAANMDGGVDARDRFQ